MKARISKSTIDRLPCGKLLVDTEIRGFVARRLPTATITYGMRYRDKATGQRRWIGLGVHGELTPDQARTKAERCRGEIADRRDPLSEKQATRAKAKAAVTLGNVMPVYLDDRKGEFRATVLIAQTRYLNVHWRPLHDIALNDLKRANVVAVIDMIAKERGRAAADRARTSLSAFFTWAIDEAIATPPR
jgi:Arm DNA-binding domain